MEKTVSEIYLRKITPKMGRTIRRLQEEFGESTASKATLRTMENYFPLKKEKDRLERELSKSQAQVRELTSVISGYVAAGDQLRKVTKTPKKQIKA